MKILAASRIRELDAYTIQHEPVSSIELMERASRAFVVWFCNHFENVAPVRVFCGKGNNGGDGLAIARMLSEKAYSVEVYLAAYESGESPDFTFNLSRLCEHLSPVSISMPEEIPAWIPGGVVIDALLGSGLSRPAQGLLAGIINRINSSGQRVVSVDIASGLYADKPNEPGDAIVKPEHTLSFQLPKLSFFLPENGDFTGAWEVLPIGLSEEFIAKENSDYFYTDQTIAASLEKKRPRFSHKGTFGHALIMAGSYGKLGAAFLAGKACLRAGAGLLTMYVPACGYQVLQTALPEAMTLTDPAANLITGLPDLSPYSAIGAGPGLGQSDETARVLEKLLTQSIKPLVLDADALNLLSAHRHLLALLPENTIITPHPKEFNRLAGDTVNGLDRLERARAFAAEHRVIICLKGANTAVVTPEGKVFFNSTGNPGMATGGTGDVLTGIITSLLAQGYAPLDAAIAGVYAHGQAGDRAAALRSERALIASDLIDALR